MTDDAFADILSHYVSRAAYTPGQLARLSELPKSTIVNWTIGRVQHPRDWQSLVRLLAVLQLEPWEADRVLQAAGHPPLPDLRRIASSDAERALLASWQATAPDEDDRKASTSAPFQAVADTPYFVGREAIRRQMRQQLRRGGLCTLQGMPGVGKTTLAARLAYELRQDFPDGVLWARLSASNSMTILSTFARAFGVNLATYPDADSRARVVRSLLADRRVLMVLDDASDSASVEVLLPPSGPAAVLLTTRRRDLRVAQRGRRFDLQPFAAGGSTGRRLFTHFLGVERVQAEDGALSQLAQLLGHLPLALTIAAGRLAWEPGWSAQDLLERLQTATHPLENLRAEEMSVRQAFHASFEALPAGARRLFAALSVFEGHDFDVRAATSIAGASAETTHDGLRLLHGLSLLETQAPGRYRLHPLLQEFAAELPQCEKLSERMVTYFAGLLAQEPDDTTLEANLPHFLRAIELAAHLDQQATYAEMAVALGPFLLRQGRPQVMQRVLRDASSDSLPATLRGRRLLLLAQVARQERRLVDAEALVAQAQSLDISEKSFQVALLGEEGTVAACQGDYERANDRLSAALLTARRLEQPSSLSPLLKELGATALARGRYAEAQSYYAEAQRLAQAHAPRDLPGLFRCLGSIAIIADDDYERGRALFTRALAMARAGGTAHDAPLILNNLAAVAWQAENLDEARNYLQEARAKARQLQLPAIVAIIDDNVRCLKRQERPRIIFD